MAANISTNKEMINEAIDEAIDTLKCCVEQLDLNERRKIQRRIETVLTTTPYCPTVERQPKDIPAEFRVRAIIDYSRKLVLESSWDGVPLGIVEFGATVLDDEALFLTKLRHWAERIARQLTALEVTLREELIVEHALHTIRSRTPYTTLLQKTAQLAIKDTITVKDSVELTERKGGD